MPRKVPGTLDVEGREFFYLETPEKIEFHQMITEVMASSNKAPMPKDGGVIEEKARIILEDGTGLLAISYKGDLVAWRQKLIEYCELMGYKWGIASKKKLILSDRTEINLSECKVFYEE